MNLLIVGHGRAGKDEAGEWFGRHTSLVYGGSTSTALLKYVYAELVLENPSLTLEQCWQTRHANRQRWYEIGNTVRNDGPLTLVREVLEKGTCVTGIRDIREVQAIIAEDVFTDILWIERNVPRDPTLQFSLTDIAQELGRYMSTTRLHVVVNNGGLDQFHRELAFLADALTGKTTTAMSTSVVER